MPLRLSTTITTTTTMLYAFTVDGGSIKIEEIYKRHNLFVSHKAIMLQLLLHKKQKDAFIVKPS